MPCGSGQIYSAHRVCIDVLSNNAAAYHQWVNNELIGILGKLTGFWGVRKKNSNETYPGLPI